MSFFGAIVRTVVNVATLPVAVVRDITNVMGGDDPDAIKKKLQQIKDESDDH